MTRTGRPREFDRDKTLTRARDLFWHHGYAETSVQDLVDELGVQRGSLYGTYGDKHAFYLEAVALYWRENRTELQRRLQKDPVLPVLRALLVQPATITGGAARRGCLIGNTATQLAGNDAAARTLVDTAFTEFVADVAAALRRGQAAGEVSTAAAPEAQAQLLLLLFQGSALVGRVVAHPGRLADAVDVALSALEPSRRGGR